jgi:hypothetical protein
LELKDDLHNSLLSVAARLRAVCCLAFLANSPAIGLLAAKRRLAVHPDPHNHRHARVMQSILQPKNGRWMRPPVP